MITSFSNKKVKEVIELSKKAKARREQDAFVVEGIKMFLEAPIEQIEQVFVSEKMFEKKAAEKDINKLLFDKLENVPYEVTTDEVFAKMSDTQTPQGILCVLKQFHYSFADMTAKKGVYVVLENLQDPGNLGTIFRTSEGAGVSGIIMSKETVDIYNPKTIRSTMGSIYRMPFFYTDDLKGAIENLKNTGIKVYAAHLKGEQFYDKYDYSDGCAFLIGNEGNGLTDEIAGCADCYLKIPMEGQLESLNAAVSTAILIYEAHRQKQ